MARLQQIRRLRLARGLTQEDLAEQFDMSVRTVRNIEAGRHGPAFDTLESLSRALGVEFKGLFDFGGGAEG